MSLKRAKMHSHSTVIFVCLDGGTLKRHIVKVARALAKVASNVHDLDSIMDYLQVLGKLHHQHGMQVRLKLILLKAPPAPKDN